MCAERKFNIPEGLTFGKALRLVREVLGITQLTLATGAGMALDSITSLEDDSNAPVEVTLYKLASALDIIPAVLMAFHFRGIRTSRIVNPHDSKGGLFDKVAAVVDHYEAGVRLRELLHS